jgi:hypothetical protein
MTILVPGNPHCFRFLLGYYAALHTIDNFQSSRIFNIQQQSIEVRGSWNGGDV